MVPEVDARVRPFGREDLPAIHGILRHPGVVRQTLQLPSLQVGWMGHWLADPDDNINLVAELLKPAAHGRSEEQAVVGMVSLHRFAGRQRHVAGLGIFLHPAVHGRGIGIRLMEAALDAVAQEWQVSRVELLVYPDNEPALRLYRRFGFQEEGRLAQVAIVDGTYVDAVAMAHIRPHLAPCADVPREDGAGHTPAPHGQDDDAHPPRGGPADGERRWDAAFVDAEGLEVRPPEPADAPGLVRLYSDPDLIRNSLLVPDPPPDEKQIAEQLGAPPPTPSHVFVALLRGSLCGEVKLAPGRSRTARSARITLLVPPPGSPLAEDLGASAPAAARVLLEAAVDLADRWLLLDQLRVDTYLDEDWLFPVLCRQGFALEARYRMAALRDGCHEDRLAWGRSRP
jgi:putative acetyltransferase